jgi:peptide/nickel transport system permease protein
MKLIWFVLRRVLLLIPVLLGIMIISFTLSRVIPADPVRYAAGQNATEEMVESLRSEFGLDKPLTEQFFNYVKSIAQGNLGRSLTTRRPVIEDLSRYYPATLELVIVTVFLGVIIGVPAGVIAARYENRLPDHLSRIFAFGMVSVPGFWLALVLQLAAAVVFKFLPISGRFDPNIDPPTAITHLYILDSLLTLNGEALLVSIRHIFLPALALSAPIIASITRMSRAGMVDALRKDSILNAKASGLPEVVILLRYAFRSAMIPILSMVGLSFTWSMAGSVLIENIFNWPGLGHYVVEASLLLDYNPLMGTMLAFGLTCGIINIFVDIGYGLIDPRIRESFNGGA